MNKNRKAFSRLLSVVLVLAICITTVFGCMMSASAVTVNSTSESCDHKYDWSGLTSMGKDNPVYAVECALCKVSGYQLGLNNSEVTATDALYPIEGVNIDYSEDGTMSLYVHITNPTQNEKLVICKKDGTDARHDAIVVTPENYTTVLTDSSASSTLGEGAKMYTILGLSVVDLSQDIMLTRVIGDDASVGVSRLFSLESYTLSVINGNNVYYPEGTTDSQKEAEEVMVAAFYNYVLNASKALKYNADKTVPDAVMNKLNAAEIVDENGEVLLQKWSDFVASTFEPDSFTSEDQNLQVYSSGINLKGNPYLIVTFVIKGDYALDKANVVATFNVNNQMIAVRGNEMTNNEGAGSYHLARLKGIDVTNLHKDIELKVAYNTRVIVNGTLSVEGFVNVADSFKQEDGTNVYEKQSLAAKSLIYYSQALASRNAISNQSPVDTQKTAYAIYDSADNSLKFYNRSTVPESAGTQTVYTGFDTAAAYTNQAQQPWKDYRGVIETVEVVDNGITPVSTAYWFYGFKICKQFINIGKLNTTKVTSMERMFSYCEILPVLYLDGLETENVTNMSNMFSYCKKVGRIFVDESFKTDNLTKATSVVTSCTRLTGEKGTMFSGSSKLEYVHIDGGTDNPGYLSHIDNDDCAYAIYSNDDKSLEFFYGSAKTLPLIDEKTAENKTVSDVFVGFEVAEYTSSKKPFADVTSMVAKVTFKDVRVKPVSTAYWFYNFSKLATVSGFENIDTSAVKNMSYMFYGCNVLQNLDLVHLNTENVTNMDSMFYYCKAFTEFDASVLNTQNVTKMSNMFNGCIAITEFKFGGLFTTENVTTMNSMFQDVDSVVTLDLTEFNTKSVTNMGYMFRNSALLQTIYVSDKFVTNSVTSSYGMFEGCGALKGGNGTTFSTSNTNATYAIIDGANGNPGYFTAK